MYAQAIYKKQRGGCEKRAEFLNMYDVLLV